MDEQDLQRRAALAVERQRTGDGLFDGVVEVHLGQHDARVLGIQPQRGAQPVRARMQLLQVAGGLVRADEGEHIDLAAGHQRAHRFPATAVDDVDHPRREAVTEGFEQRPNQQHAELGRLEHHGVAHDQRRDQRGEGFVQRVVVWPHAQGHAQWCTADLAQRALFQLEAAGAAVEVLEGVDGVDDVVAGAVEFLFRILEVLADLPHQQLDHGLALFTHACQEGLDVLDALGHAHVRPGATAFVVGLHGGIEGGERGVGIEQRGAAQHYLMLIVAFLEPDRAAHRGQGAVPAPELAVHQIVALFQGGFQAPGFRDVLGAGEE
ncbi:hypothetical protein D3C72_566320 [compost metagenome]